MRVKSIGLGGTGGCLLPDLVQLCRDMEEELELVIVDDDKFEPENAGRQRYSRLGPKAEVRAEMLTAEFPGLYVEPISQRVTEENVYEIVREGDLVLLAVDNPETRRLISDCCSTLRDVTLISGGNSLTTGTVLVYVRKDGEDLTLPLTSDFHEEIRDARGPIPSARPNGCAAPTPGRRQRFVANRVVATMMLCAVSAHLDGKLDYDEVSWDSKTNNSRRIYRRSKQP